MPEFEDRARLAAQQGVISQSLSLLAALAEESR